MRLRHIEVIEAILHAGNTAAAAELLGLTPDILAATLLEAEQQLGFLLFAKVRGRLQATPETLILRAQIAEVQSGLQHFRRAADALRLHQERPLRVACTEPLAQQLLPMAIATLRRRFQDTQCSLASQDANEIVRHLLLDDIDLGLSLYDPEHPQISTTPLAHGKVQLLAPRGWLTARQKYIGLQQTAGQSMIGLQHADALSHVLESRLISVRPSPRIQTRVHSYQMMRSLVEAGEGLALVDPFTAAGAEPSRVDRCPVSPVIPVTLFSLSRHDREPGAAHKALVEIVEEKARALLGL